jgi:hypothetical protein
VGHESDHLLFGKETLQKLAENPNVDVIFRVKCGDGRPTLAGELLRQSGTLSTVV